MVVDMLLLDAKLMLSKSTMEFQEGDGRRLFTVNLWSELPFVSFGLVFFSLSKDYELNMIKSEAKPIT
ncbi:hypothetical protein Bca4012_020994 [Brassica carinata]